MHTRHNLLLLATLAIVVGCSRTHPIPSAVETGTVTVEINTTAGTRTLQVDNVAPGTTVETLMRSIDELSVTIHGSGVTAFVDTIGETSTSGGGGWTYTVDGEYANKGIGSTVLTPPTTVAWSFVGASEVIGDD